MTLKECLLRHTHVGELVLIMDAGWQIGCTMIDNEDLFIGSLSPSMLLREVKSHYRDTRDWTTRSIRVVNLI